MPAKSKSQQRLFGMVHALQKKGGKASKKVQDIAASIGDDDADDFAKTKHKGLPEHKKKKPESFEEWLKQRDPALYESATTTSDVAIFMNRLGMTRRGFAVKDSFFDRRR